MLTIDQISIYMRMMRTCEVIYMRMMRSYFLLLQEAQLSQRDRAMLPVIEYFAKSLELTQGHSK